MNKLVGIIDTMGKEDLLRIQMDLKEGNLRRIVEKRLGELQDDNKVCPVCGEKVKTSDYKLEFGKAGLRMRASFDGPDCLKNFVENKLK